MKCSLRLKQLGAGLSLVLLLVPFGIYADKPHTGSSTSKSSTQEEYPDVVNIRTQEEFDKEVLQSSVPVAVKYYADWCGACTWIAGTYGNCATKYKGKIKLAAISTEDSPELAKGIKGLPTFAFYKDGKKVTDDLVGATKEFETVLLAYLGSNNKFTRTTVAKTDTTSTEKEKQSTSTPRVALKKEKPHAKTVTTAKAPRRNKTASSRTVTACSSTNTSRTTRA